MSKSLILVALLFASVLCQTNTCPGFAVKDLLQSGKFVLMNMASSNSPDHKYEAPLNFKAPSWGFDLAVSTGTIGNYKPAPGYGYNYFIENKVNDNKNGMIFNLIMENDDSWTTIQISYLACARSDMTVGNFQSSITEWSNSGANVNEASYNVPREIPKGNYKVAVFISGFSTTDNEYTLSVTKRSYDSNTRKLLITFFCSANPVVFTISFTYIIYPEYHPQLDIKLDLTPRGDVGSYQISGPVNFQPNKNIQYNQWRVQNRYLPCNGTKCSSICELREDCNAKGGSIYQGQCIYCPDGVVLEFGRCNRRCGSPNMRYVGRVCICASGFKVEGKDCVSERNCPENRVWNETSRACTCAPGYYTVGPNCQKCPPGADSTPDGKSCVCKAADKYYEGYNNTCKSRCQVNQQWADDKCVCIPQHCWWNKICRRCPDNSDPSQKQDTCICKSPSAYYNLQTNTCIQCSAGQILNKQKNGCTCPTNFVFDAGFCVPVCKSDEYLTSGRVCQCKPGLQKGADGNCKNKCAAGETWDGNSCECSLSYARFGGVCKKCPQGSVANSQKTTCVCSTNQIFSPSQFKCVNCVANSSPSTDKSVCVCNTGYVSKNGACVPDCKDHQIFDVITGTCSCRTAYVKNDAGICVPRCTALQEWNGNACVCLAGNARYGTCKKCPEGSLPNVARTSCICTDSNQIFNADKFICVSCQANSKPTTDLKKCACNDGYVASGSSCILDCGANQVANNDAGRCDCVYGYSRVNGKCTPRCTKANQQWNGDKCVCKAGFGLFKGVCTQCPQNSNSMADRATCKCITSAYSWNPSTFKCNACPLNSRVAADDISKCVCNKGYEFIWDNCLPICGPGEQLNKVTNQCQCKYGFKKLLDLCVERCGINQQWVEKGDTCRCKQNHIFSQGVCRPCTQDSEGTNPARSNCICKDKKQLYNAEKLVCEPIPSNSVLNDDFTDFKCLPGYKREKAACNNPCPTGASPNQAGECTCGAGFYLESNQCKKTVTCPERATWDANKLLCVCQTKNEYLIGGKCQACKQNSFFSATSNSCVCSTGFFSIGNQCRVCDSKTTYNGVDCICNIGFYGNRDKCDKCHQSCATCSGPEANQCITCSDVSLVLEKGYCSRKDTCDPGSFVGETGCDKCTDNCIICSNVFQCKQCAVGYRVEKIQFGNQQIQACVQICGDGIKYEQECDDGNTADGDGCSSSCTVEKSWSCSGGSSVQKSKCIKYIPEETILVSKNIVNTGDKVIQLVRASYLPTCLTENQCVNCFKLLKVNVITANVPITVKVSYVPFSQYQFLVEYDFQGLFVTSAFRTIIKLNNQFLGCLHPEDYDRQIDMTIDPAFLAKVDGADTLDEAALDPKAPPQIPLSDVAAKILGVAK